VTNPGTYFLTIPYQTICWIPLANIRTIKKAKRFVSIQLLPVGCHPERSEARHQTVLGEGSNNLEILRLSASE